MRLIHFSDHKQRHTRVALLSSPHSETYKYVDDQLAQVEHCRYVKNTLGTDLTALTKENSLEDLSNKLVEGDPELDFEVMGKRLEKSHRIFLKASDNSPAFGVYIQETRYKPNGDLIETRDFEGVSSNINEDAPLVWSNKLIDKVECCRKYVFKRTYQLKHSDGLSFDFLLNIATELAEKSSLLIVGAGKKANQPLITSRNGKPYRGFLEGRIKENEYMLLLHVSNLELKLPETS